MDLIKTLSNIFSSTNLAVLVNIYKLFGRGALVRMFTIPSSALQDICKKTGANLDEAKAARDKWAEATVNFVEEVAIKD